MIEHNNRWIHRSIAHPILPTRLQSLLLARLTLSAIDYRVQSTLPANASECSDSDTEEAGKLHTAQRQDSGLIASVLA